MRLKKKEKSVGVLGKILNLFSNSNEDTYSCDYINNIKDVYSTEEVKTNKVWVDGKPIYRKVLYKTGDFKGGQSHLLGKIDNVSDYVRINAIGAQDNNVWIPIPETNPSAVNSLVVELYIVSAGITIAGGTDRNFKKIIAVVEYTKTTD